MGSHPPGQAEQKGKEQERLNRSCCLPIPGAAFATKSKAVRMKSLPWQGEVVRKPPMQDLVLTPGAVDLLRGLFICGHKWVVLAPLVTVFDRQRASQNAFSGKAGEGMEKKRCPHT